MRYLASFFLLLTSLFYGDIYLEFKGAYFLPTDSTVKKIYGNGGALYGPEVTFQFVKDAPWYGFASADFLSKEGHSIGLGDKTKMWMVPVAVGFKYFVPFGCGNFYVGAGFQPLYLRTVDCSSSGTVVTSKWGPGGIAKIGSYFQWPGNFFSDLFVDYSYARVAADCSGSAVNMSGFVFGLGFGYTFAPPKEKGRSAKNR